MLVQVTISYGKHLAHTTTRLPGPDEPLNLCTCCKCPRTQEALLTCMHLQYASTVPWFVTCYFAQLELIISGRSHHGRYHHKHRFCYKHLEAKTGLSQERLRVIKLLSITRDRHSGHSMTCYRTGGLCRHHSGHRYGRTICIRHPTLLHMLQTTPCM